MGRIRAPFGVRGWLKIQPFSEQADALLGHREWWLADGENWRTIVFEEGSVRNGMIVARIAGVDTPEQAAALRNRDVAVPRSALPPEAEGEFYWADLEGMSVANPDGADLGVVTGLMDNGAHEILVVRGDRERLIPFVDHYVLDVDRETRRIVVDWGLDY
ncbi:MAG: ribosome maturation factor RimM [Betaproteobacteria bacterium]|nr:ribosome maturation factor RimM [Betaproteobacteria bacterium]